MSSVFIKFFEKFSKIFSSIFYAAARSNIRGSTARKTDGFMPSATVGFLPVSLLIYVVPFRHVEQSFMIEFYFGYDYQREEGKKHERFYILIIVHRRERVQKLFARGECILGGRGSH